MENLSYLQWLVKHTLTTWWHDSGDPDEFAFALTYSFIEETGDGIAPSKPKQSIVPVLSLELISENILSGLEKENDQVSILPGIQLWNPASGWHASLGVEVPISSYRDNDFKIHFTLRNHFDWGRWLK